MRVLFSTGSPARYMRPPSLGDEQVNCGPDWADERAADGRIRSLATPTGDYDLATVAAKLPPEQQPDVVVCLVDASWRNVPHNLAAFKVPRVLLVADTHHLRSPLIGMLRYLAGEPFDRVVFLYDRHHAAFFHAAGFRNLHWFPGLTFPHGDAVVRAARNADRTPRLAFVGQAGNFHPRRTRLLAALAARGLPLAQRALPQDEAPAFYGSSLLGFNASLNGDLNLRVFEILAAGTGLLTDRLAAESGLARLFPEGREIALYGDERELTERAADLLGHPAEAAKLGAAGAQWFDRHLGETPRHEAFRSLAFDGVSPALFEFEPQEKTRVFMGGDIDRLLQGLMVYEGVQELHRTQEKVRVALDADAPVELDEIFATLPRVEVSRARDHGEADLAVFGRAQLDTILPSRAARLWCRDAQENDLEELGRRFAPAGLVPASRDVAVFCRAETKAPATAPVDEAAQALVQLRQGNHAAALDLARSALAKSPRSVTAYLVLGELALARNGAPLAEKLFRQALALQPGVAATEVQLARALCAQGRFRPADEALGRVLRTEPHHLPALLALAHLRLAEKQPAAAETALREAARRHPSAPEAARELGVFLKREGRALEALGWQRRALGCADPIPLVDPAEGPVRAAFIVQHPQGWTSLESVWRAMEDDPAFAPVVIAAPYRHPYPTEGGPEAIYGFLARAGVPFAKWNEFPLRPGFADIVFIQNPYDVTRPEPLHVAALLRLVPRIAYVPYGLEIGGGERNNTMVMNMPLQQLAWMVFARSERQRRAYAVHCDGGNAHVAVTGHAKLDALRDLARVTAPELDAFAAGRKIVGWNPHFDLRPDGTRFGTGFSTFLGWWKFIVAEFARRPDLALVVRPHPLLFGTLESRGIWTRAETDACLREMAQAGNILVDRGASYLGLFARSSAMLSDASSFVLEYAATGKPLLYLHNPSGPALNEDGEFVERHLYTARVDTDIAGFLDQVAAGRDPHGEARRAAYADYMHQPPEGVGVAVKNAIHERLVREAHPAPATRALATG